MSLDLSSEEVKSLRELYNLSNVTFSDERYNNSAVKSGIIKNLSTYLVASATGKSLYDDSEAAEVDAILKSSTDKTTVLFAESIAVALTVGYLQSLNNDRVVDEEPEFGFEGLDEVFQTAVASYIDEFTDSDEVDTLLESGLGVVIRDCTSDEYFEDGYYHDDIEVLSNILTSDIDDGYNKNIKSILSSSDDISTSLDVYMEDLKAVYTLLLEDSFGISPYVGVLSDGNGFLTIKNGEVEAKTIEEGALTLRRLAERVNKQISGAISISDSRQFDYDDIFDSNHPVYFPRKILEYVSGRESTLNMNKNVYKNSSYSESWGSYSKNYVFPNLREVLVRGYYKALEKVLLDKKKIKFNFISREFMYSIGDYKEFVMEHLADSSIFDAVTALVVKVVRSLKCFYILTKYPYMADKIVAIYLRVTCEEGMHCFNDSPRMSETLFKGLIAANNKEEFINPFNLTQGRTSATNVNVSVNIYEYQYDINPMLAKAEPLFGYVIQKQNQKRGVKASWDNILIGESMSGKELYASRTSDIKLQDHFIHNIIAGSRSGKGVMTMNVLVSAIASGKPVFYLDRKPDMASLLYQVSGGSQFIVNGGNYNPGYDTYKVFGKGGKAMALWGSTETYLKNNPKILELFNTASTAYSDSILADYVYFRAFMFCLGLCVLRVKLAGSDDKLRSELFNGNDGIVIVVDELTGFQASIGTIFANFESLLVRKAIDIGDSETVLNKKADLEAKLLIAQTKVGEANKESARLQQEAEIARLQRELDGLFDEQAIYANTLFSKVVSSYSTLVTQKNAGFKNNEFNFSDIFVLGQALTASYYSSNLPGVRGTIDPAVFFPTTSDRKAYYSNYKGADIIRSFLEELCDSDWFLGRNIGSSYGGKMENTQVERVTDKDGNWDYVGVHTCREIRMDDKTTFSHVLFKPYLVLNTHFENDPPTVESDNPEYKYVYECAGRVNGNAGGINLWDSVRLKHIRSDKKDEATIENPCYGCLEDGIGFKGLVKETLATTEKGKSVGSSGIDEYISSVLGKSGDIANFVAGKMGYSCWQELLFDFSPNGFFSFDDMVNAVISPEDYTLENRLPLYAKLNKLSSVTGEAEPEEAKPFESFDDRFGDISSEESKIDGVVHPSEPVTKQGYTETPTEQSDSMSDRDWFESQRNRTAPVQASPVQAIPVKEEDEPWSDSDKRKIATLMVGVWVMCNKDSPRYKKLCGASFKETLVGVMYEIINGEGY